MISDPELQKTFKVFLDDSDIINVVYLVGVKDPETQARQAELIEKALLKITKDNPQNSYKMLADLLSAGDVGHASDKSKQIYSRLADKIYFEKTAVVGTNVFMKAAANVIFEISGRSDRARWFGNKEEAIKWLKKVK